MDSQNNKVGEEVEILDFFEEAPQPEVKEVQLDPAPATSATSSTSKDPMLAAFESSPQPEPQMVEPQPTTQEEVPTFTGFTVPSTPEQTPTFTGFEATEKTNDIPTFTSFEIPTAPQEKKVEAPKVEVASEQPKVENHLTDNHFKAEVEAKPQGNEPQSNKKAIVFILGIFITLGLLILLLPELIDVI